MPLLSLKKRKESSTPAGAVDEAAALQAARTRARRRLIGAAVLVGAGIVGFPLLFETQPRPVAVNIPIEIPSKDQAPPLALPASKPATGSPPPAAPPRVVEAPVEEPPTEPATRPPADTAREEPAGRSASAESEPPAARAQAPGTRAEPARAEATAANRNADAQRAQDLLDGRPVAAAAATTASEPKAQRFVVQAGAYTDSGALRDARQKVEKLGLKTYTQVIESDAGSRTRVRVGPFATRDEAEKAAARIKAAGLAAAILAI